MSRWIDYGLAFTMGAMLAVMYLALKLPRVLDNTAPNQAVAEQQDIMCRQTIQKLDSIIGASELRKLKAQRPK